jgi:hypothetical protein
MGYYSINSCGVEGTITLNGIAYQVQGTGYYDHFWLPFFIGGATYFWDWFSVHFTNGYHAFIWQIIPLAIGTPAPRSPGFFWITDGLHFTKIHYFSMTYLEYENTSIPFLKRPDKFLLSSTISPLYVELYFDTLNMHEYFWWESSVVDIGLWEGTCNVTGSFVINGTVSQVTGTAICEIFRIM